MTIARTSPPKLLVLDLGNVVFRLGANKIYQLTGWASEGPQIGHLRRLAASQTYEAYERDEIDSRDFIQWACAELNGALTHESFVTVWNAMILEPMPGIRDLLNRVTLQVPVAALSNTNRIHYEHMTQTYPDITQIFSHFFTSFGLGYRKPQKEIFERITGHVGLPPHDILFIDDLEENIRAAAACGWRSEHYSYHKDSIAALLDRHGID